MRSKLLAGPVFSGVTIAILSGVAAHAQTAPPLPEADKNNQVTVTATRTEQRVDEVPATVTVITDKTIENELATDIEDLVRFEPGVSVRSQPQRFGAALGATGRDGNSGFNIRGLEGNRVLIQTDGVRIPDGYSFGPTVNGRGDFVDLDLLKSVEILRGPASALYGSDGVAGAVSFITRDPDDIVQDGRRFGVRARTSYASQDDSVASSLITAGELGDWSAMVAYTHRNSHETENVGTVGGAGAARDLPNPIDNQSDAILGKIVWAPGDNNRFRLTYDYDKVKSEADILSGRTATVVQILANDKTTRSRLTFDHTITLGEGLFRSGKWAVYTQDVNTRQYTYEDRTPAVDRTRDNRFDNSVWGANGQLEMGFETGAAKHQMLVGADYSLTKQSGIRGGTVPTPPDTFPARAFPLTEYTLNGIFLSDQISFLDGALTIFPALRYDAYELEPQRDPLFPSTLPIAASDGSQVSPKLGVVVWPTDWIGGFANYASGYKAPEPSQVNSSFSNLAFGYTSIPSPDLKPESSDAYEVGLRTRNLSILGGQWSAGVTGFSAAYQDFILQAGVSGGGTPTNPTVFQYININEVDISGWEASLNATWENGFGIRAATSKSSGRARGTVNGPLDSIDPAKTVLGFTYDDPQARFGGQLVGTYVDGKQLNDVISSLAFRPPSFAIFDLTAYWNFTDTITLRAGGFNLTDEAYWWYSDVRTLSAGTLAGAPPTFTPNATLPAYTQPGRNYSVSLTFR